MHGPYHGLLSPFFDPHTNPIRTPPPQKIKYTHQVHYVLSHQGQGQGQGQKSKTKAAATPSIQEAPHPLRPFTPEEVAAYLWDAPDSVAKATLVRACVHLCLRVCVVACLRICGVGLVIWMYVCVSLCI